MVAIFVENRRREQRIVVFSSEHLGRKKKKNY